MKFYAFIGDHSICLDPKPGRNSPTSDILVFPHIHLSNDEVVAIWTDKTTHIEPNKVQAPVLNRLILQQIKAGKKAKGHIIVELDLEGIK